MRAVMKVIKCTLFQYESHCHCMIILLSYPMQETECTLCYKIVDLENEKSTVHALHYNIVEPLQYHESVCKKKTLLNYSIL